jgi:lipopolysaccharide/colanic/teichoic acid biosynthesis glycosyltransferase
MDLDYVYEPSLKQDINLIAKTLPAILSGKGAY